LLFIIPLTWRMTARVAVAFSVAAVDGFVVEVDPPAALPVAGGPSGELTPHAAIARTSRTAVIRLRR